MSRPAFAKPTRSLRCSIEVDPNCVEMICSAAASSSSRSSPMSASISLRSATASTSLRYSGRAWFLTWWTTFSISLSATHAPCTRRALEAPIGRNRPSP